MIRTAVFSPCGLHRYRLYREWDASRPSVLFIMLNPSSANGDTDDPTTRRIINYAKAWGYGSAHIGNLCSEICTTPSRAFLSSVVRVRMRERDANETHVAEMCDAVDLVIYAWGHDIEPPNWLVEVEQPHCLAKSKRGWPKHPLYLRKTLRPIPFIKPDDAC